MSNDLKINDFLLRKLAEKSSSLSGPYFDAARGRAVRLSNIGVDSSEKAAVYTLLKNAGKAFDADLSDSFFAKNITKKITNMNDAYFVVLSEIIDKKGITKVAYPNSFGSNFNYEEQVDLSKWLKTVHLIYDAVNKGEMSKSNSLEYYSNFIGIDEDEKLRFKKWFEYYSEGEHLKYSSFKESEMNKKAVYTSNLGQTSSTYSHGGGSSYLGSSGGFNMPGDSFGGESFDSVVRKTKSNGDDTEAFNSWKNKLHGALRRIDKLLRSQYMDGEKYKMLAEHLLNLSHQVHCLKFASTISDVTYKTAGTLQKHGQSDAANMLIKVAQEVPENEAGVQPQGANPVEQTAPTAGSEEAQVATPQGEAAQEEATDDPNDPKSKIPSPDDVEPVELKDITPLPGARQGEYEELAGEITLDDAASKLDEVAGMLADRRIIRQLAEFDIMLDKIGIASMFPELAESQSKLIDSFSYALTRVTKMMGQLANAKSIIDSRGGLPGKDEAAVEQAPDEPSTTPEQQLG